MESKLSTFAAQRRNRPAGLALLWRCSIKTSKRAGNATGTENVPAVLFVPDGRAKFLFARRTGSIDWPAESVFAERAGTGTSRRKLSCSCTAPRPRRPGLAATCACGTRSNRASVIALGGVSQPGNAECARALRKVPFLAEPVSTSHWRHRELRQSRRRRCHGLRHSLSQTGYR